MTFLHHNNLFKNIAAKICILFAAVFIVSIIFSTFSETTFAINGEGGATTTNNAASETVVDVIANTDSGDIKKKISEFATLLIALFTPIIAMTVKIAGLLIGDAFIHGNMASENAFPIADLLYELWDVVRTIVNYIFLLILLFVAIMNILPMQKDQYQLTSVLPSLVIGIVVVNMTWFMTRVIFDAAEVATHIVYALPESLASKGGDKKSLFQHQSCIINEVSPSQWNTATHAIKEGQTEIINPEGKQKPYVHGSCYAAYITAHPLRAYTDLTIAKKNSATSYAASMTAEADKEDKEALAKLKDTQLTKVNYGALTIYWSDFDYSKFDEGTILPLMAFSMMQVQNLPRIASSGIQKATDENGNFILPDNWTSLFINTVFALILMVIILILFVIMVVNLFGRVIILWVNIIASPVLALNLVADKIGFSVTGAGDYLGAEPFIKQAFAPAIMGLPFVIGFILISVGQQYPISEFGTAGDINLKGGNLVDGLASFHALFYHFLTIAVLWAGGIKAMEYTKNPVTGGFTDGIISTVKGIGNLLAKAPMQVPFIPIGKVNGKNQVASFTNLFEDTFTGLKNRINLLDNEVGSYLRQTQGSRSLMERKLDIDKDGAEGKQLTESLKKIELNTRTFDEIAAHKGTESENITQYLRNNKIDIPSRLIDANITYKDFAGMIFEARNSGSYSTSVKGQDAIRLALTNVQTPPVAPTAPTTAPATAPTTAPATAPTTAPVVHTTPPPTP